MSRILALASALVLLLTGFVAAPAGAAATAHVRWYEHKPLPDPLATPGRAFWDAGPSKFCHAGYTAKVRSVSDTMRRRVFAEYGIPYSEHSHYELDHLIPLELGGNNTIKNLWPERGQIPNAKDGVENELHDLVCEHKLGLHKARHAIRLNWVKALHRYGHTGYIYDWPSSGGTGGASGSGGGSQACTTTSSGSCIKAGEFCPQADYGQTGYDAYGNALTCTGDASHPHWE